MSGKAIICVGGTGKGKTTFVKSRLRKVNKNAIHLYDVNNEYTEFYKGKFTTFETFTEKAAKITNAVIVFEESTIFFSHTGSSQTIREILVRKRHTQNTIIFVFHSLRQIPRFIIDMCNYMVIFKTNDNAELVEKRFDNEVITSAYNRVKENKDDHFFEVVNLL